MVCRLSRCNRFDSSTSNSAARLSSPDAIASCASKTLADSSPRALAARATRVRADHRPSHYEQPPSPAIARRFLLRGGRLYGDAGGIRKTSSGQALGSATGRPASRNSRRRHAGLPPALDEISERLLDSPRIAVVVSRRRVDHSRRTILRDGRRGRPAGEQRADRLPGDAEQAILRRPTERTRPFAETDRS